MRRPGLSAAMLAALGSIALSAPAWAGYGAVAQDRATGKAGWAWNQPTQQRANEAAMSQCGASGCKVLMRVGPRDCGAFAATEDGKVWGASARKSVDAARLAALANCNKAKRGECVVKTSECNK